MIIVADSGSTKCDWIAVKPNGEREELNTMGFNPFFHNEDFIENELRRQESFLELGPLAEKIFFYGAGASSDALRAVVRRGLSRIFPKADIHVSHDLDGAAYAVWDGRPAIVCILGTGSNSCFVDEYGNVTQKVPALGYILGDEGSGSYFGKKLLSNYLYEKLPVHIHNQFKERYELSKEEIFQNVYMKPNSNVYLASFMRFLSDNRDNDFVRKMIYKGFSEFISTHIWKYENHREVPVHFVGSVAYYFQDLLREESRIHYLNIGNIVKQPVLNLVEYHIKNKT